MVTTMTGNRHSNLSLLMGMNIMMILKTIILLVLLNLTQDTTTMILLHKICSYINRMLYKMYHFPIGYLQTAIRMVITYNIWFQYLLLTISISLNQVLHKLGSKRYKKIIITNIEIKQCKHLVKYLHPIIACKRCHDF